MNVHELSHVNVHQASGVDARAGALGAKAAGLAGAHTEVDPRVVQFLKVLFSQSVYRYLFTYKFSANPYRHSDTS